MSLRPYRTIIKRKSKEIKVGNVKVGGSNPISVQSMTNTLTTDVIATVKQIEGLVNEGADLKSICLMKTQLKHLKKFANTPRYQ